MIFSRPKSICTYPGCGALIDKPSRCERHQYEVRRTYDKKYEQERGTKKHRGYGSAWDKARHFYLLRHPLCVSCKDKGITTPAKVVDHIEPHRLGQARDGGDMEAIQKAQKLFWDANGNWQSLCLSCHAKKSVRERLS